MELADQMIDKTLEVNTVALLSTVREFLPSMIANKRGHIVTIASMAGLTGVPGLADYCASKSGAVAIDECLRMELQGKGLNKFIKTTCICPYLINTGMFDGAQTAFPFTMLDPPEVVDRIIAAIQQEEAFVVIPWRGNVLFLAKLLPTSLNDQLTKALGTQKTMSEFKGKGAMDKRIPGYKN